MFRNLVAGTGLVPDGEQVFTSSGTFTVPNNVTQLSIVAVGGGGGGSGNRFQDPEGGQGGSLAYATINVTPGEVLTVNVGAAGAGGDITLDGDNGGDSSVVRSGVTILRAVGGRGGNNTKADANIVPGDAIVSGEHTGGAGGAGGSAGAGGGGAAGYSGNGGAGANGNVSQPNGDAGSGGGGGGGAYGSDGSFVNGSGRRGGNGGGVGIFGQGANGAGGIADYSSGSTADENGQDGSGGNYGAGGATYADDNFVGGIGGFSGTAGAVRIVYPGQLRRFPSQNVGA